MILYTNADKQKWETLVETKMEIIEKDKQKKFIPTRKDIDTINNIILDYIKKNNKKIYGGYAQNKLIENKNKEDAFYKPDAIPDIDIYSCTPIQDIINICNLLHKAKFKNIDAGEAQHTETYKIHVEFIAVLDISYVPANIYNRMPFIELDGFKYVKPWFMMLDMYKMLTDPYHSSFRWEKMFPRIMVLQKYFPFRYVKKSPLPYWEITKNDITYDMSLLHIYNFIKNKESLIIIGHYTYNYMLYTSGILSINKLYKQYNIPYYQIVSTDYKNDSLKVYNMLKEQFPKSNVTLIEHYPLWTLYGYNNYISIDNKLVCHIIHYNKRCSPIKKVIPILFSNNKVTIDENNTNFIQISSFDYMILTTLCYTMKGRSIKDDKFEHFYNTMTSMLVEMRNYYFKKQKKNMFDDTIFEEYLVTCIGDSLDPGREARLKGNYIYKELKKRKFKYNPHDNYRETDTSNWKFQNTSGHIINNIKNFRVLNIKYVDKLTEFEDTSDEECDEECKNT
jgi:hypothetical protein